MVGSVLEDRSGQFFRWCTLRRPVDVIECAANERCQHPGFFDGFAGFRVVFGSLCSSNLLLDLDSAGSRDAESCGLDVPSGSKGCHARRLDYCCHVPSVP